VLAVPGQPSLGVAVQDETREEMLALLPRLRRFAIGLTGSAAEGDDLVQATYERAIRRLDSWQPGSRLDSWMYRIARNLFLNQLRANRVRSRHLRAIETSGEAQGGDGDAFEHRARLVQVRRFIERLPEEQRAALLLVAVEGLSYAETARVLGIPLGTVTSRVGRARISLRQFMDGTGALGGQDEDREHARQGS
jgi:RNA polymerase sigma-70 factor (ECF subfamily)